jgi:PTS system nitrogen regulatory IIA component
MARKLGVSPAFLSQIEAGRQHKIPKARIVQVAKMLGVSEGYLLGTAHRIHPEVVEFLRQMPEAAEFMITAMREGLGGEDFARLREAIAESTHKRPIRRAKVSAKGKRKKIGRTSDSSLEAYLEPSLCLSGVGVQNKSRLFQRFVKLVTKKNKWVSADELLEALEARERQAPTGVGGGVAIPHAFFEGFEHPVVGAVQLRRSIPYGGAGDDEKVRTVFFLIGDENKPEEHISNLARIARLCSDATFLQEFNKARTHRELYKTIIRWDQRISRN